MVPAVSAAGVGVADRASRRDFMKLMTASMALAGLGRRPIEPIVPYVRQTEPTCWGFLFTLLARCRLAYAAPVFIESHEGRQR
jgi:hypothetical protein